MPTNTTERRLTPEERAAKAWRGPGHDKWLRPETKNIRFGYAKAIREVAAPLETRVLELEEELSRMREAGKWISVGERLPDPLVRVLVRQQYDDDAFIANLCNTRRGNPSKPYWYAQAPDAGSVEGDGFWDGEVDEAFAKITHWQYLPTPPQEGPNT